MVLKEGRGLLLRRRGGGGGAGFVRGMGTGPHHSLLRALVLPPRRALVMISLKSVCVPAGCCPEGSCVGARDVLERPTTAGGGEVPPQTPPPHPLPLFEANPQRVRMSSGEGPIGTAKGKPPNTEALPAPCQPPRPPHGGRRQPSYSGLWTWMQSRASSHWHNGMPANGGRSPTGVG